MRLLSYTRDHVRSFGVMISDGRFIDVPLAGRGLKLAREEFVPQTLDEGLRSWDATVDLAQRCLDAAKTQPFSSTDVFVKTVEGARVESPVSQPSKIVGIGLNYKDHCREQKVDVPAYPIVFAKFSNSIIGPGAKIRWNRGLTRKVDFEAELGVVIGKRATRVQVASALDHVAGYTAINDVSARDMQFNDRQWVRGKSLDTFCPIGPFLVTQDEIGDPHRLGIRCSVNGVVYQDSNTAEMIFSVPELIAFITQGITLEAGDVIATGTPAGVGAFRKPQVFLQHGDEVIVSIEKIGELRNSVETIGAEVP